VSGHEHRGGLRERDLPRREFKIGVVGHLNSEAAVVQHLRVLLAERYDAGAAVDRRAREAAVGANGLRRLAGPASSGDPTLDDIEVE
jgi:hypothetical protein